MYEILRHKKKIIYSINYDINIDEIDSNRSFVKIKSFCQKKDLNEFLKLFYEKLNNFKINIKIFKLFKQKLLFDMDYII